MTAPVPEISRKQAWCKLAVLIADGLPDPAGIKFHADRSSIYLDFNTAEALAVWAERLGQPLDTPIHCADGDWIHGSSNISNKFGWHGYYVRLAAYTKGEPEPEPVDDDMATVRAIAAEASQ